MVDKISSWASGLIVAVIIGTIIEMIIPDNKNKKYIKVVIGFFIIYTIMAPIIGDLDDFSLDVNQLLSEYTSDKTITTSSNSIDLNLQNVYKQNIEKDIEIKLKDFGYSISKINTEIDFKEENYGMINSISVRLKPNNNQNNSIINNIEEVEINVGTQKEQKIESNNNPEIDEIKKYLNNNYGIELNKIYIELV